MIFLINKKSKYFFGNIKFMSSQTKNEEISRKSESRKCKGNLHFEFFSKKFKKGNTRNSVESSHISLDLALKN